jgi:hypothetical protein
MNEDTLTIVSGLPRSGTSLMMRMLEAGGMEVLTDHQRAADDDNPRGYYEFEPVKRLKDDPACLEQARGKVVKIISELLRYVPQHYPCKVVFMRRSMAEILASQRQMLVRRSKPTDTVSDEALAALFEKHLRQVEHWLTQQPHMRVLYVNYNELIAEPAKQIQRVDSFLDQRLDTNAMTLAIDPTLYRQRSTK